jgi:hypothetical protein
MAWAWWIWGHKSRRKRWVQRTLKRKTGSHFPRRPSPPFRRALSCCLLPFCHPTVMKFGTQLKKNMPSLKNVKAGNCGMSLRQLSLPSWKSLNWCRSAASHIDFDESLYTD